MIDCAGGALPDLITIAGGPSRVVTIADFTAAAHGVHFSRGGADPLAVHGLAVAATRADEGGLPVPVAAAFPLTDTATAHELSESRHARGKIVLVN